MVFHVSADWLRLNGLNPEKAGHIEITNIDILLELLGQGNEVVLQLLMNAYRLKMVPKPLSDGIIAAYAKALEDRRYESVPHRDGDNRRAPALFLASTYFAELSEAYLDSNEYYPFIRSDIAQYDPYVFPILSQIWGD